ncbi:MAG: hypothetical protein O3A95_06600 [Planctomycetota bacterium]|nr:hypothetical protein [Planctomycetota bacterium]
MSPLLSVLSCGLLLASCIAPQKAETLKSKADAAGKTEVFVLGMIHSGHRTSETWGLEEIRATIKNVSPDVICVEIPPSNWPSTLATWKEKHVVEDSRVKVFPEYVDVLMPLTDEMDFVVEPSAGWSEWMAQARGAKIKEFQTADVYAELNALYEKDEAWVNSWLDEYPAPGLDDDPFYIHSPRYDLRTKAELGPYEHHLNDVIGRPGGWTYINEEHFLLIEEAIRKHPGKRILVTFGAGHKYWFLEQLRWMPDVELMDVRPYLPNADAHKLQPNDRAREEFMTGFDAIRVHQAHFRGDSIFAWDRIDAMLDLQNKSEFLTALASTKGTALSEFQDGPFLGPVNVTSVKDNGWRLSAKVWRLHETEEQAEEIMALLERDASRPGGFTWTELTLPSWMLEANASSTR